MRTLRAVCCWLSLSAWLAACGPVELAPENDAATADDLPFDPAGLATADLERGELLSLACQACHPLRPDQKHNVGPNLYGIFGRASATADGFAYSGVLGGAGLVWTPEVLNDWLADPAGFLPGNNMAFSGYREAQDRTDLIAFLIGATGGDPAAYGSN